MTDTSLNSHFHVILLVDLQLEQFQTTQMNYLAERRTEAMRRHRMEYEQRMAGPYGINQRVGFPM